MYPGDRAVVAERALARTGFAFGDDPRRLVLDLGLMVLPGSTAGCGGEATDGVRIAVRWSPDRRVRGLRVFHGIAHALLVRERWEHSHADAWLVTMDLAVPRAVARSRSAEDIVAQAHVPEALARGWAAAAAKLLA